MGYRTNKGKPYYPGYIIGLLRNGVHFAGRSGFGKARRGKYHRRGEGATLERVSNPDGIELVRYTDWIMADGGDALISWDLWERCQARIEERYEKRTRARRNPEGYLVDFLYCAKCGKKMTINPRSPKENRALRYCCGTYRLMGRDGCTANSVRHQVIESYVLKYLEDTGQRLAGLEGNSLAPLFDQERKASGHLGEIRLAIESFLYDRLTAFCKWEQRGGYRIFKIKLPDGGTGKLRLPDFDGKHTLIEQLLDRVETRDQSETRRQLEAAGAELARLCALFKEAESSELLRASVRADIAEQERLIQSLEASLHGLGKQLRAAVAELAELSERIGAARELLQTEGYERRTEALRGIIDRVVLAFRPVMVGSQEQHHLASVTIVPHLGDEVIYAAEDRAGGTVPEAATSRNRDTPAT
jgi:hypothetical protein